MVTIQRGQANIVVVTLTEKTTISNPTYLFAFYREEKDLNNPNYQSCIAADISEYPERYNKFTITEKNNPVPLNGEVYLRYTGAGWYYKIFAQTSTTNLNPANANELVEQGKVVVLETETETPSYDYNTDVKIYKPS